MQVVHDLDGEIRRKKETNKETNNKTHTKSYPSEISLLPDVNLCPGFSSFCIDKGFSQKPLTGDRVCSTLSFRLESVIAVTSQPWELEGAGHVSPVTRSREQQALRGIQARPRTHFLHSDTVQNSLPRAGTTHSGWLFPPQLSRTFSTISLTILDFCQVNN